MRGMARKHKIFVIISSISLSVIIIFLTCMSLLVWNRISRGVVPTEKQVQELIESGGVYDHVVIFGVDGAGGYFNNMDTPGFDKVFKNELDASITYEAVTQLPVDSGPNWASMMHGVPFSKHHRWNDNTATEKYTDTNYPSFFKVHAQNHPEDYMVSVVNWSNINYGIIEDIDQLGKVYGSDLADGKSVSSEEMDSLVADEAIRQIKTNNPKIVYTHFDCVDHAGHTYGWGKPEYEAAISYADSLIERIYDACVEIGWKENTLFMCVADHGHKNSGGHWGNSPQVRNVVFAVAGGKGNIINGKPEYVVVQDFASVVTYALGDKQPDSWEGGVPKKMFKGI